MDLILWRHAEAEPQRDGLTDLQRALTSKGERQAQRMAEWLDRRLADTTRILVSPAVRTEQTVEPLGRPYKLATVLQPGADPAELLRAVHWPTSAEPVLVVGHQPTLGLVASLLLCGQEQPWAVKKGAVWWLRSRQRDGVAQVTLHAVQPVDLL
ncbi:SixA phosphatase family protein [Piscinibacter sakaiensis]|uniref:SixA phosphatase family protein n=1 Tax=Piscinibacter sakaiensis TaxID=1547922 RepID=UPI003AAE70B8